MEGYAASKPPSVRRLNELDFMERRRRGWPVSGGLRALRLDRGVGDAVRGGPVGG
jgi:hypothetical protein